MLIVFQYKLSGIFLSTSMLSGRSLLINKIQHIIVTVPIESLCNDLIKQLEHYLIVDGIEKLILKYLKLSRYDDFITMLVKITLQYTLPDDVRINIVNNLFA